MPVSKKRPEPISRNLPESPTLEKSSHLRGAVETIALKKRSQTPAAPAGWAGWAGAMG